MTSYPEIAFEGTLLDFENQKGQNSGWVEYRGVLVLVDLSFVPSVQKGETLLIYGRTALSIVEDNHAICR